MASGLILGHHGSMSSWQPPDMAEMRVSYDNGTLAEADLADTPLLQFAAWLEAARAGGLPEPNAMVLATVDSAGTPTTRTVLLKGVDPRGFTFFTNYTSRKAEQMAGNPRVSLCFPWIVMHRQVTVVGTVEKLPEEESSEYFDSRPHGSRLAAWTSRQSTELSDRAELERRYDEVSHRWPEGVDPPRPDFWGGYLVRPESVEFWQGRVSRLHDRLRFTASHDGAALDDPAAWRVSRLWP